MAFNYSPKIVTSGLVLYYDAANPRSYPGTGTTIYDLSRSGNHGTLINGVTYNSTSSALVFDGVDDYIQFNGTTAGTVCFWGVADVGATSGLQALVAATINGDNSLRFAGGTFRAVAPNAPNNNDYHVSYVNQLMINGVSNLSTDASGFYIVPNGRTMNQNFYVGALGGGFGISAISHLFQGRVYKGKVFKVLIYNRQLTNSELLQNYNAHRKIYGL
jgi:hypothetical protein